jgi:hypothetical protein
MKIKFLSGPRAGQFDHAPISQETDLLVKAGLIEVIPYKNYQERLADTMSKPATASVVSWGVRHCLQPGESQPRRAVVIKTVNGEQTIYDAPPPNCPQDVVQKFRKAVTVYEQIIQDQKHAQKVKFDNQNQPIPRRG